MSTQYNTIQEPYDAMRKKSIALIEYENVHDIIAPYISEADVLELACGSGFYTPSFLKWGASSVVGVDISQAMLAAARQQVVSSGAVTGTKSIKFLLGDCSKPTQFPGAPFDLVFGAWLLNYAPDRAGLVDMFRNIAMNLKAGGRFVGVTMPPVDDPVAFVSAESKIRPPPEGSGLLFYTYVENIDGGAYFSMHGDTEVGAVDFDCYHLRKDIYESAAREGGLKGELQWEVTSVPDRYLQGKGEGGASMRELESYKELPNYGLLVIEK